MHSQVSIVTYTDFGQNMGRYRVNGVNDLLSSIRREEGGVVITYLEGHDDYTMDTPMISFESQGDVGALAAIGYNYIATVQHNACQNPTFTKRYVTDANSLHYYGTEYRDALTFCLVAQSEDQQHTQDYKVTRLNRLITDVTPSTPLPRFGDSDIVAQLNGRMEYRSGAGNMSLWTLDGTKLARSGAYQFAIGGMRLIDNAYLNNANCPTFFTTVGTMDYSAQGISEADPLPFAPAGGDSGSPVWVWDAATESYLYMNAYQSIFGDGQRSANARGAIDYTWDALEKFDANVGMSGNTVHIKGVTATSGDQVVTENILKDGKVDHTYTATLHKGSVQDEGGRELAAYVGVKGGNNERIDTWLNLAEVKDSDTWFAYDNKYYNVGNYGSGDDLVTRQLKIEDLFFTSNLVFQSNTATGNTVVVDADTDLGIGYLQFKRAEGAPEGQTVVYTLQSAANSLGRNYMVNSAGFVVEKGVALHVQLTNTEQAGGDYYYREWRKVGDGDLYLEGSGNNGIFLNVGGPGKTYLAETGNGYAAYNVFAGSGATVVLDNINQIARDFTFGYTGATLDIRGNNSMDWYFSHADATAQGFAINSQSEDAIITNSGTGTLSLTYRETGAAGESEYLGSFVDTATGAVHITFNAGSGSETTLRSIHTDLSHNSASGITVQSGKVVLSGTNTRHGLGSVDGIRADRFLSTDDWHYADSAANVLVKGGATFELGSHARLDGNVTLETGATAIIREGVHSTFEYIEGGLRLEDTTRDFYRDFYGLKGDIITSAGSTVRFEYSPGTSAEQVYGGNITGDGNAAFNLGGSGATLRLSGNNTFSGTKSLSGGGLISDNGLAALGDTGSIHWLVDETAYIAAYGASGTQLLDKLNAASAGVLALTADQAADLNLQQNHFTSLFVGALAGEEVVYGTAGARLATVQNGGRNQWLLGGGGGSLIVDFALQDDTAELVLGNEYTTGSVTLTNSSNEIGTISFKGQVTLNYTSEAALGHATVDLNYTNRMQLLSLAGLDGISPASPGVVLVDKLDGAALDMTAHPELYIGSSSSKRLDAAPVIASGAAYRFGGIDGALTVNAVLADVPGRHTGLYVDGQTYSGGVLELAKAATITGAVDVRGYDPSRMLPTMAQKGDITLRLTASDAIGSASAVTMENGGIIDIYGTTQTLNNLSVDAGSLVTDSSLLGSGVLNLNNTEETTIHGILDVALVNKTGSGTLNLSGTSLVDAYNVQQGTLNVSAPAAVSGLTYVQNGATLSLAAGDYGIVAALQDGANLQLVDNATITLGGLALADNATANFSGGTLKVTDADTIVGRGATLNMIGANLILALDEDLHFTNTLRASGGRESTVTVSGGNKDTSYTRVFDNISVDAGSTLTLTQEHQETCPIYTIHNLTGAGELVVYTRNYKDAPAHYILDRDTQFAGTFTFKAGEAHSAHPYMSHLNIQSENALANAQLQMYGWSGATGYITLGIDTDNANVQGLSTENTAYSVLMAGYTESGASALPVSTRRATLTILGNKTKEFKGRVADGANGTDNGLSIVMNGTGTQIFSGVSVFNDVSALKGNLSITNKDAGTVIKGDITVARGASLTIANAYTLSAGKTIHVVGSSATYPATLEVPLTLSGGTIDFSGAAIGTDSYALMLDSVLSGSAVLAFSDTSYLHEGTYYLANGDWRNVALTCDVPDYLDVSLGRSMFSLTATFTLKAGNLVWDGNTANHVWNSGKFGQRDLSFTGSENAVFTDTAESRNVQVESAVSANSLIFDSTGEYTMQGGGMVTAATLSQIGSGTTNIDGSVEITGQAHVKAGTLAMHGGAYTGSVLVEEGGTLSIRDSSGVTTGTVSGDGTLAIDWGEGNSGSFANIGQGGIGTLRVVSGTLTTAAQLKVKNRAWVEQGATLSSGTGAILPAGQALHLAGSLELNLSSGSLQTSITGYNGAKGSVLLNSTGTSTIAANTTVDADTLTVNSGTVSVDKAAALMVDSLAVGPAATAQLHRDGASTREIGSVQMAAGATLSLYNDSVPSTAMGVDSLVLGGASASVVQDYISGAILFRSLSRTGDNDVTLNLDSVAAYQNISVFELGGADDTPGDFAGEIALNCTSNSSYKRSSALMLDDANVAAGAVINLKSAVSNQAVLALGVNAEVVNIAGLASNSALGDRARLFSGSVALNTMPSDEAFAGSRQIHRLVITTASGKAYDFHGRIGRNVDLTVDGGGTQRLLGTAEDFNGMLTVQGGTLEIGNAPAFGSPQSETGGFNATLAGGTLALRGGGLNLRGGVLLVTGDTTISLDTPGESSYRDGSDRENGFSLMTVVSAATAVHTAGTLTGQGVLEGSELMVMDNGVYALDSTHGHAYYVNTTVDYGPQAAGTAYANADSLVLNRDGAVLNMQAGLSPAAGEKGITAAAAGGTVNLAHGVTLHQSKLTDTENVKIGGVGTYQAAVAVNGSTNTDTTLGVNNHVTLADGWAGTVELVGTGGANSHLLLENYGNSASTVKLTGTAGWLTASAAVAANLLLEDSDTMSALTIKNGAIGGTETFNGSISGSGTMEMDGDSTLDFKFNGDLSNWTGTFKTTTGTANVYLLGSVDDVAAAIQATSLTVGSNVTFHNTVKAGSLTANGGVTVGENGTLDLTELTSTASLATLTVDSGSTLALAKVNMLATTGTLAVEDGATLNLTGLSLSGDPQSYVLATGGTVTLGDNVSFTLADESLRDRASLDVVDGTSLVLTLAPTFQNLVWQGPNDQWTTDAAQKPWYKEGTQTAAPFKNGDNVRFGTASSGHTATLGADITAAALTVNENASVTLALNGHALATETLTVDSGSTLTVNGSGRGMEAAASTIGGAVVLGAGTTLKLNGAESDFTIGRVTLNNGSKLIAAAAGSVTARSVFVADGSAAEISLAQDMTITAGGSDDNKDGALYTMGAGKTLSIHSADDADPKTLTVDKLDIANHNTAVSLQNVTLDVLGAATVGVLITDRSNDVGSVTVGGGAELNFNGSVDWHKAGSSDVVNLTVQNGGAVHVNKGAANTLNNITVQEGGALSFAAGTSTALFGTLSLQEQLANSGTLDFGGRAIAVTLGGDDAATTFGITPEGYTDIHDREGDNGFHHTMAGDITSGSGSIVGGGGVAITLNGSTVTGLNADGSFGTVDTATYHVRSGSVDYDADLAGVTSITTVAVSGNAALNVNTALAANVGITSAGGTVNIANAVTLQAASLTANAATTLTGGGTYAISYASASPSLGSHVSLGEGWQGVLRLSGGGNSINILLNTLAGHAVSGVTEYSTVEFDGASGYFQDGGTNTFASDIMLAADHDNRSAMNVSNGNSNAVYTFSGKVEGSGTFERSATGPGNLTFTFTGDVSDWDGVFKLSNAKDTAAVTTLNFSGNPVAPGDDKAVIAAGVQNASSNKILSLVYSNTNSIEVTGDISNANGGTLNMTVAAGTDAAFSGNVTGVSSLTLAGSASFSGTNTFAGVTVQDGASLCIAGGITTISGSVSLAEQVQNDGAISFGGSAQTITLTGGADTFHVLDQGYIDIDGNEGDNGFHHGLLGTVVTGDGTISGTDHVTVSYNGGSHALNADGTFGAVDKATYHVRSGSVDYGADLAGVASITTVAVSGNAALNVNTGLAANVGITSSGGSINIAENVTVDQSSIQASAPTTLGGKGRLVLANNSIVMPDNVTLGADWKGVVAVSGLSLKGTFTPAPLANDNSWIEIKGLSGYLSTAGNSTYVVSSNLVLARDADGWAFKQNDGYGGSTVSFTGAIKGSGNLGRSVGTGSTYTYEFSGDISGWNGQFISTNNNNCYTMFRVKGDATLVNAELVQSNSTASNKDFRVEVQNHATFTKSLSADKLTVTSGGEAAFTGESVQFKDVTLNAGAGLVISSATTARFTGNVDLYEAITNNGILTIDSLSGIEHLSASEDSQYKDGYDSHNGFLYAERVQVVNMGENAQLTVTTKPTSYNGKAGTLDTNTGVFSVTKARESYDTFYVNKAGTTESLANAILKSSATVESIRMAGGTTLDASNVSEGTVVDNLVLREHGDAAPATITGGTAAFGNLVMEGVLSAVSVEEGAKLKVGNVIEVETNRTLATGGDGSFEAVTLRSTGGVVQFSGNTLVSGGGNGQNSNNKNGLAITGNGGSVSVLGGVTNVLGAVYTNARDTAIEIGGDAQAATLVATRLELGDNEVGTGSMTVGAKGKLVVTGGVNDRGASNLKTDSLVLGEWKQAYTTNVQGSLYARDAIAMLSKDAAQSVSVQGGTMAVKGVWSIENCDKNHSLSVTGGGKLILGESGIAAENGSWNIDVTDSELGMYADTTVGRAVNLHGKVVVNTDKYEFKGTGAAQEVVQGASAGNMAVSGAVNADANATLSKAGSGKLEITGSTAGFHGSVEVQGGVMDIMNAASVDVQNVTIGSNGTLGVYKNATAARETDSEGTITIREAKTLTAGKNAALNANLVMESGSTLDVAQTEGMGLLMGSEVTLSKGMTLNDYSGDWATWKDGTTYTLFTGVDGLNIGNGVTTGTMDYTQWVDAKEYFSNIEESNRYFLCYGGAPDQNAVGVLTSVNNGSNVGMVYIMTVPEPATGTLSLLALAALAARRRRKA